MTEDEAKTKWCPFARVIAPITMPGSELTFATGNRVTMPQELGTVTSGDGACPPAARCIGSACMAWRWGERTYARSGGGYGTSPSTTHGFCGLTGSAA